MYYVQWFVYWNQWESRGRMLIANTQEQVEVLLLPSYSCTGLPKKNEVPEKKRFYHLIPIISV